MPIAFDVKARYATGSYMVARDIWKRELWSVYSPTGVIVASFKAKKDAEIRRDSELEADKLGELKLGLSFPNLH